MFNLFRNYTDVRVLRGSRVVGVGEVRIVRIVRYKVIVVMGFNLYRVLLFIIMILIFIFREMGKLLYSF